MSSNGHQVQLNAFLRDIVFLKHARWLTNPRNSFQLLLLGDTPVALIIFRVYFSLIDINVIRLAFIFVVCGLYATALGRCVDAFEVTTTSAQLLRDAAVGRFVWSRVRLRVNTDRGMFAMTRSVCAHPLNLPKFSLFATALGSLVRLSLLADEER